MEGRFKELCMSLAANGLILAGREQNDASARKTVQNLLVSGKAAAKFEEIIAAQGGDQEIVRNPKKLPSAPIQLPIVSSQSGCIIAIDAQKLGRLAMRLGAGREKKEDKIDPAVGIELKKKTGDRVEYKEQIAVIHLRTESKADEASRDLLEAITIGDRPPEPSPVVYEVVE
jgi:pyrimidine-nucleoside phosphorylase